jgi:hypothetical protein
MPRLDCDVIYVDILEVTKEIVIVESWHHKSVVVELNVLVPPAMIGVPVRNWIVFHIILFDVVVVVVVRLLLRRVCGPTIVTVAAAVTIETVVAVVSVVISGPVLVTGVVAVAVAVSVVVAAIVVAAVVVVYDAYFTEIVNTVIVLVLVLIFFFR